MVKIEMKRLDKKVKLTYDGKKITGFCNGSFEPVKHSLFSIIRIAIAYFIKIIRRL
jgi:hypothetical protein